MNNLPCALSLSEVRNWFAQEGFDQLIFNSAHEYVATQWGGQPVTFKLTEREGFDTFYKEAFGGSLIVFETSLKDNELTYEGYCPILVFGFFSKKLSFKKKAGPLTKYRKQGFEIEEKLKAFLGE